MKTEEGQIHFKIKNSMLIIIFVEEYSKILVNVILKLININNFLLKKIDSFHKVLFTFNFLFFFYQQI